MDLIVGLLSGNLRTQKKYIGHTMHLPCTSRRFQLDVGDA